MTENKDSNDSVRATNCLRSSDGELYPRCSMRDHTDTRTCLFTHSDVYVTRLPMEFHDGKNNLERISQQ